MKSPAFQFYAAEFIADENVAVMSNEEVGCYIKLICYCWREGSIPSEIGKIARLCGVESAAMAQLWPAIKPCFDDAIDDAGRLVHPRLDDERRKQAEHRTERSSAGLKGAKSRWGNKKQRIAEPSEKNGSAIVLPMAKNGSSSSSSSSSSDTPIAPTGGEQSKLVLETPEPEISTKEFAAEIFALYPRKDGKAEALKAITEAFKIIPPIALREKVSEYARAVAKWPPDQHNYVPWCQKWMRKKRWVDDPSAWVRGVEKVSIATLKAAIEAKQKRMAELKRRFYSDTQSLSGGQYLPPGWRDENARIEYLQLKKDLEKLNHQLSEAL